MVLWFLFLVRYVALLPCVAVRPPYLLFGRLAHYRRLYFLKVLNSGSALSEFLMDGFEITSKQLSSLSLATGFSRLYPLLSNHCGFSYWHSCHAGLMSWEEPQNRVINFYYVLSNDINNQQVKNHGLNVSLSEGLPIYDSASPDHFINIYFSQNQKTPTESYLRLSMLRKQLET
uniref:FERM domain-containing protein n=1 Tax=Heterorhabditis bacteriophora TaxID=37862 RepID=A0A1I7WMF9_HETBA